MFDIFIYIYIYIYVQFDLVNSKRAHKMNTIVLFITTVYI